jgi:hypothetical protein
VPALVGFHEIDAGDEIRIVSVDRDVLARAIALKPCHLRRLDDHALDREFLTQLPLPLEEMKPQARE